MTTAFLGKAPTGIPGFDEITNGGLPAGRPTLVCGGPGSGKTLFAMSFLHNGITMFNEPGVFMSFEEKAEELALDVASMNMDVPALIDQGKLLIDYVEVERSEVEETGEYDLEGLFVRLGYAVDSIGAKRVVLDTIESLFSGLSNEAILRAEFRRLFRWLRDRGLTVVITGEKGANTMTRYGLEEYVSDVVIHLDHRVHDQISTRRIRVLKYRGSVHGTNEYPFLIDSEGVSVLPVTSLSLQHDVSSERVPAGIPDLDAMLDGKGYFRGSTIMVAGGAGTGKSNLAAHFIHAACARGESCLSFLFEESPAQVLRNTKSAGMDLRRWVDDGLLHFHAERPSRHGLETHLVLLHRAVEKFKPRIVVVDPITNMLIAGSQIDVRAMLTRIIDFLKVRGVTALFTSLTHEWSHDDSLQPMVSSLMDTRNELSYEAQDRNHRRWIRVVKSRGMAHSDESREFRITEKGITILKAATKGDRP